MTAKEFIYTVEIEWNDKKLIPAVRIKISLRSCLNCASSLRERFMINSSCEQLGIVIQNTFSHITVSFFVSLIVEESGEFREVLLSLRYATHCLEEIVNLFYELAYHLCLLMFVQIAGSQRAADQALPCCIFQVCAMLFKHNYDLENVITDFI